jgi:hypothetical protein
MTGAIDVYTVLLMKYWTVSLKKPRIKHTVSSLFSPYFGFSFSPLFFPFSSALGSSFMAYKCNLHSYRIALKSEKILDIFHTILHYRPNIQGVSKEGSDDLEEEK